MVYQRLTFWDLPWWNMTSSWFLCRFTAFHCLSLYSTVASRSPQPNWKPGQLHGFWATTGSLFLAGITATEHLSNIITKYRENGCLRALDYRVENFVCTSGLSFCPCLLDSVNAPEILLRAIDLQINAVKKLYGNLLWTCTLEGMKDANIVDIVLFSQNALSRSRDFTRTI